MRQGSKIRTAIRMPEDLVDWLDKQAEAFSEKLHMVFTRSDAIRCFLEAARERGEVLLPGATKVAKLPRGRERVIVEVVVRDVGVGGTVPRSTTH